MQQWLRKTRVTFFGLGSGFIVNPGGLEDVQLRVKFSVEKSISSTPNEFSIQIWGMNEGHRQSIGKEFDKVQLEAGYMPNETEDNLGVIAEGHIRDVQHSREGNSVITTISCGDGDAALRKSTISETFPSGTSSKDVVESLFRRFEERGLTRGEWEFPDDMKTFNRPYSMCGSATREMDLLGRGNGFYWSVQNGSLEIIPSDGFLRGGSLISKTTGMIGIPVMTDNGVKVTALLNADFKPNRAVVIRSDVLEMNSQDDQYRIGKVNFEGDNEFGNFIADLHCESISDGRVDIGVNS